MIIDAHAHVTPPIILSFDGRPGAKGHTPDDEIKLMDECGIDKTVIVGYSWPEDGDANSSKHMKKATDWAIEATKKYSRLIPYDLINYCLPEAVAEITRSAKAGVKGVKVFPMPFIPIDSKLAEPVFEALIRNKLQVTIHSDFSMSYLSGYKILRVAEAFPELTINMAHMGMDIMECLHFLERDDVKKAKNLNMETSGTAVSPYLIRRACQLLGAERVIYGTDTPYFHPSLGIMKVKLAGLSKVDTDLVLGNNMARILGLKEE